MSLSLPEENYDLDDPALAYGLSVIQWQKVIQPRNKNHKWDRTWTQQRAQNYLNRTNNKKNTWK